MLKIFVGGLDVTEHYIQFSYKKTEQLKNRANKCTFQLNDHRVVTNQIINIWDTTSTRSISGVGTNTIEVFDVFPKTSKFVVGKKITVNIGLSSQREYEILSINYTTNTITLTENITFEIPRDSIVGLIQFAGVSMRTPEKEVSCSDDFTQTVSCVDYKKLLDRKNVAEIFLDQYPREIFGRILYEFAATDTQEQIDPMETPRTNGGTAGVMTQEPVDRIFGNYSLRTSMTTGLGFREETLTSFDISSYTHLRMWWKVLVGQGAGMNYFKIKIGTDSSNYFQYDVSKIGEDFEDCRNYEAVKIYEPESIVGNPDLANIVYIRYEIDANADISDFIFDQIVVSTGGFTLTDTIRGGVKLADIRIKQKKISDTFEQITRLNQEFRYLNPDRSISYYIKSSREQAPIEITTTNKEFGSLVITADTTDMRNRQLVIGAEAIEAVLYTQELVADGEAESFRLDYGFAELKFYIQAGGVGPFVEYNIGIENLGDPLNFDWMANFAEKIIRIGGAVTTVKPSAGDVVRYTYFPYKPIAYQYKDQPSVEAMKILTGGDGIYDGEVIIDRSIQSQEEARLRAKAEVEEFKNPVIDCIFKTNKDGIHAAQLVLISDVNRDIDDTFLIQRVSTKHKGISFFEYTVMAATTLFGITEFLQMLLRRTSNLFIDQGSQVFIVVNIDETIVLQDVVETHILPNEFKATLLYKKDRDFERESGVQTSIGIGDISKSNWTLSYTLGQIGELSFDAVTNHNNGKAMQLTTNTDSGEIKALQYIKGDLKPSTDYELKAWIEVLSITTLGVSPIIEVIIDEIDLSGVTIKTNILSSTVEIKDFKHYSLLFTSHANSLYYRVSVVSDDFKGVIQIADIKLYEQNPFTVSNPGIADFSKAS